jgi:hypothetical protein
MYRKKSGNPDQELLKGELCLSALPYFHSSEFHLHLFVWIEFDA